MDNLIYIKNFIQDPSNLYHKLLQSIEWDHRMHSRKTASFGQAYNYSQIHYSEQPFLDSLKPIVEMIYLKFGFRPNNCLVNYYVDGKSRMGWHSDQTDILHTNTGIVIISLGTDRVLKFRNIKNSDLVTEYILSSGSLIYMDQTLQKNWQHAIPKSNTTQGRLSLTFRSIQSTAE